MVSPGHAQLHCRKLLLPAPQRALTSSVPPQSFTLEFHFEPNDFFTNTVLTKTYKMRSEPDENDPFSFDGPEIMCCTG